MFQFKITSGTYKGLARRTLSDEVFYDEAFNIAKIHNMLDIKVGLFKEFINFLIKDLLGQNEK